MRHNNTEYSGDFYDMLYRVGIYAQPDGTLGISDRLPQEHIDNQYISSFNSLEECIAYLESELNELISNYVVIWNNLEQDIDKMEILTPNHKANINDDLMFSFINSIIEISANYKDLQEVSNKLSDIKKHILYIDDSMREKIGYYSILLQSLHVEIIGENRRLFILKQIKNNNSESDIKNMLKYAYYSPWGMEEGVGPRGRNNPMTPFGGYDYWYDRVMDGTDLHDYSGGHATEKFLGRDGYNKYKRYPELLRNTRLRLRTKPLRYLSREKRRKLRAKNRNKKHMLEPTGLVRTELVRDPTHYYWWDQQNNNPYAWKDRGGEGVYPTWDKYR